nr:maco-A 73 [Mamestra configurata nucleopolyhedrovirus A]
MANILINKFADDKANQYIEYVRPDLEQLLQLRTNIENDITASHLVQFDCPDIERLLGVIINRIVYTHLRNETININDEPFSVYFALCLNCEKTSLQNMDNVNVNSVCNYICDNCGWCLAVVDPYEVLDEEEANAEFEYINTINNSVKRFDHIMNNVD